MPPYTWAQGWLDANAFNNIHVVAQVPMVELPPSFGDPVFSKFSLQSRADWVTHPATAVSFGTTVIGKTGGLNLTKTMLLARSSVLRGGLANFSASSLTKTQAVAPSSVMVVSGQGLRSSQLQSLKVLQSASGSVLALSRKINS